ncbi:helix-turn-helix domain-containing protein [Streptomyces sp. NBC_01477]|uniref:helix-turn-helix domain-containing protein n=1 Tax=Streptomyces sp. NBC_01477 TaxID=2976015 RepID=UPI002E34171B|nr:helix-turn-helix transcriptional regulator [Streptomyces sp. NBC_01477]
MTEPPIAPPEGLLIKRAQVAARLSQREAAKRAGLSEARWRQLVSGFQLVSRTKVAVRSPDETLARMARAVGVTAEQLEAAGRDGAANTLRDAEAEAVRNRVGSAPGPDPTTGSAATQSRVDERWALVEAILDRALTGLTEPEHATLADRITTYVAQPPEADAGAQPADAGEAAEHR